MKENVYSITLPMLSEMSNKKTEELKNALQRIDKIHDETVQFVSSAADKLRAARKYNASIEVNYSITTLVKMRANLENLLIAEFDNGLTAEEIEMVIAKYQDGIKMLTNTINKVMLAAKER